MNKTVSISAVLMLLGIFALSASAQDGYEVKGVIQDQIGPVIGATVMEQGTANGASTGLDGDYVIVASGPDAMLEFSCIGYKTLVFKASEVPQVITLEEDTIFLDDVVVIGYGTVKKEDMTGSIVAIKTEELNRGAVVSTQDMLKGKVPGLQIIPGDGGPGSSSTIRIRGAASLNASNDPLIVIDGVPIAVDGGAGMSNPLETINPNDIESFTVLKDASSAAIYGSRASNGVIIITTKRGKGGKPQVSYSGSVSVQTNSKRIPTMTPGEFRDYVAETFPAGTTAGDYVQSHLGSVDTDWQDLIFRTAISHDHNVSLSGNVKERMPYRASVGWTSQQGTLHTSKYDKIDNQQLQHHRGSPDHRQIQGTDRVWQLHLSRALIGNPDHGHQKAQDNAQKAGEEGNDQGILKAPGQVFPSLLRDKIQIKGINKILPHIPVQLNYSAVIYFATISSSFPLSSREASAPLMASNRAVFPFFTAAAYSSSVKDSSRITRPSVCPTNTWAGCSSITTASILFWLKA